MTTTIKVSKLQTKIWTGSVLTTENCTVKQKLKTVKYTANLTMPLRKHLMNLILEPMHINSYSFTTKLWQFSWNVANKDCNKETSTGDQRENLSGYQRKSKNNVIATDRLTRRFLCIISHGFSSSSSSRSDTPLSSITSTRENWFGFAFYATQQF